MLSKNERGDLPAKFRQRILTTKNIKESTKVLVSLLGYTPHSPSFHHIPHNVWNKRRTPPLKDTKNNITAQESKSNCFLFSRFWFFIIIQKPNIDRIANKSIKIKLISGKGVHFPCSWREAWNVSNCADTIQDKTNKKAIINFLYALMVLIVLQRPCSLLQRRMEQDRRFLLNCIGTIRAP